MCSIHMQSSFEGQTCKRKWGLDVSRKGQAQLTHVVERVSEVMLARQLEVATGRIGGSSLTAVLKLCSFSVKPQHRQEGF